MSAPTDRRMTRTPTGVYFTGSLAIPTAQGKVDLGLVARALLAGIRTTPRGDGAYRVTSAYATERGPYDVQLRGDQATCTCLAAQHGAPCKHVAVARFLAATLEENPT